MKLLSQSPRGPSSLSDSVHRQLNMYALAASAAGVSLLALAEPSEAKIIYTKTHQVMRINGICPLDLNHDGNVDFVVQDYIYSWGLYVQGAVGNAIEGSHGLAAALKKGAAIGPRQRFISNSYVRGETMVGLSCSEGSTCRLAGPWVNVSNRYLGLKFQIDGKTHYGWARLSTQSQGLQITATLTGYAYETIANKELHAGQTSGGADEQTPLLGGARPARGPVLNAATPVLQSGQRVSLGRLALGVANRALWSLQ